MFGVAWPVVADAPRQAYAHLHKADGDQLLRLSVFADPAAGERAADCARVLPKPTGGVRQLDLDRHIVSLSSEHAADLVPTDVQPSHLVMQNDQQTRLVVDVVTQDTPAGAMPRATREPSACMD